MNSKEIKEQRLQEGNENFIKKANKEKFAYESKTAHKTLK